METVRIIILFVALCAYLTALGFGVVSVTTSEWYVDESNTTSGVIVRQGLWIECDIDGVCRDITTNDTIHVARAFGLMSVIVAALVLVLLLMAVNEEGSTYKILSAFILIIVAVLKLICMAVYTGEYQDRPNFNSSYWGYSFDMGWAAVFLYGVAGLLFLVVGTILHGEKKKVRYGAVRA